MSDNVEITAGLGTIIETIDEGGGVERQVIVLGSIGDASGETQLSAGQKTSANSIPIVIASDQSAVTVTANAGTNLNTSALARESGGNLATLAGAVSASKVQVTVASALPAGTNSIGIVLLGQTGADGSTSITTGGTAQNLFGGTTPTNGFEICNPDASEDLWISDSTTAALNGQGSYRVAPAGGTYTTPAGYKPIGAVSAIAATTGHKITARRW